MLFFRHIESVNDFDDSVMPEITCWTLPEQMEQWILAAATSTGKTYEEVAHVCLVYGLEKIIAAKESTPDTDCIQGVVPVHMSGDRCALKSDGINNC